jgi:nicotinamidase/pyrazinamidase
MSLSSNTVFFDVDTQLDFVSPAGSLYVPGAEKRIPAIAALNRLAPRVISTMDAHSENDVEFRTWPPHCVLGTLGQRKPADLIVGGGRQILFEKVTTDAFLNARLLPLLAELGADRYVVYGVVTEICVRFAALGLLATGKPVDVVTDAIEALNPAAAEAFFAEVTARGGRLITSSSL